MAWTYSASLTADKDKVRFLIGDTDPNDQLLLDEEIAFLVTEWVNVYRAAAEACRAGAAKLSRKVDSRVGGMSVSASQRWDHLMALIPGFESKARSRGSWVPYFGGYDDATDSLHPIFTIGMTDYPGATDLTDTTE